MEMIMNKISDLAVVETENIGNDVTIHEYAVVRKNVKIGDEVVIHPFVVIEENVEIGKGVEIFPGSYIGKVPKSIGLTARKITYEPWVRIGDECAIGPNAVIYYQVEIGSNTLIGDGASLREQVRVGSKCVIGRYVTVNYNTTIGDNSKIMDVTHITGNCKVGNHVFIGMLASTVNDNDLISREYREGQVVGPTIDDNATIGSSAVILAGINISEGGYVGANSVVTKDVDEYTLVVGSPARFIRKIKL
jgi:acetyltransferase-like isoleucine patch superfamily enzyme